METTFSDAALAGLSGGYAVLLQRGGGAVWVAKEGEAPWRLPETDARHVHAADGRLTASEPGGVFTVTLPGEARHTTSRIPADRVHAVRSLPRGTFMALKLEEPPLIWGWWERLTARMRLLSQSSSGPSAEALVASHGATVAWVEGRSLFTWREELPEATHSELSVDVSGLTVGPSGLYVTTARGVLHRGDEAGAFEPFLPEWTPAFLATDDGLVWLRQDHSAVVLTTLDGQTTQLLRAHPGALEGLAVEGSVGVSAEREGRQLTLRWFHLPRGRNSP